MRERCTGQFGPGCCTGSVPVTGEYLEGKPTDRAEAAEESAAEAESSALSCGVSS